jgi:hypothetical protein
VAGKDEEIDVGSANERDRQKLLEQASALDSRRGDDGEGAEREEPEVDVLDDSAPEPDGEEGDDLEQVSDEPRPPRAERRQNRYAETQRALEEERARRMALEAQLLTQRMPQQSAPQKSADELRAEAEAAYRQDLAAVQRARMDLQEVVRAHGDNFTDEVRQRVLAEDTNLRIFEANAQRRYAARMDQIERPPPAPQNPLFEMMRVRYRDVDQSQLGRQYFMTNVMEQRHRNPNRPEDEVLEEAFQKARAQLKGEAWSPATRERAKPTASSKAKFTGAGAGSASNGPPQTQRYTITKDEDRMAQKLYAHIPEPAERRRMYVKNVKSKRAS